MPDDSIVADVSNCARCGEDHEKVWFKKLQCPIIIMGESALTHWAMCPTLQEPIVLSWLVKEVKNEPTE